MKLATLRQASLSDQKGGSVMGRFGAKAAPCVLRVMGKAGEYRPRGQGLGYVRAAPSGWEITPSLDDALVFSDRNAAWDWWRVRKSLHAYATAPDDLGDARAAVSHQTQGETP